MTVPPLLEARAVSAVFESRSLFRRGPRVQAVTDARLSIKAGEAVGVVGESGSGKSTLGRLLLGLLRPTSGDVLFEGMSLGGLSRADWRKLRRRMQIVFQDPFGSLDPRRRIGAQIADGLVIHRLAPRAEVPARVAALLDMVGLDPSHAERFSHEFSGGQRQRIGLARALASGPDFIVADEPVSSLDVSIQAQVLELMDRLRRELGLALLFISHDLPVVRHLTDRVIVMYLGRIVEEGPTEAVFARPAHPYTQALLSATPRIGAGKRGPRLILPGEPPSPADPPSGCVFHTRCTHAIALCASRIPALETIASSHHAACLRLAELRAPIQDHPGRSPP
jgi:oligopeptide/dipeptide ABC transporter ATP-binding protein